MYSDYSTTAAEISTFITGTGKHCTGQYNQSLAQLLLYVELRRVRSIDANSFNIKRQLK